MILFPENLNVSRDEIKETIGIRGKQRLSLSDLLHSKTDQKEILKNALRFQRQHHATVNYKL